MSEWPSNLPIEKRMSKIDFVPFEEEFKQPQPAWRTHQKERLLCGVTVVALMLAVLGLSIALGISESRGAAGTAPSTPDSSKGVTSTETSLVSAVGIFQILVIPPSGFELQDAEPWKNSSRFQIILTKTACSMDDLERIRSTQTAEGDTLVISTNVQSNKNYCGDPVRLLIKKPKHVLLLSVNISDAGLSLSLGGIPNPQVTLLLSLEQDNETYVETQVSLQMFQGHRDVRDFFQCRMTNLGPFVSCQTANPLLQQHDAVAIVFYYDLINQALSVILSMGSTNLRANQTLDDYARVFNRTDGTDITVSAGFFKVAEKAVFKAFGDGYFELLASHSPEYDFFPTLGNITFLRGELKLGHRSGWESVLATNLDVHSGFYLGLLSENIPYSKIRMLSANGDVFEFNSLMKNKLNLIEYIPEGAVPKRNVLSALPKPDPTIPAEEQRRRTSIIYQENGLTVSQGGTTEALVYTLSLGQEGVDADVLLSFDQSAGLYRYNPEIHLPIAVKMRVTDKGSAHSLLVMPFVTNSFLPPVGGFGGTLRVNGTTLLQLVVDDEVALLQQTPLGDWFSFLGEASIPDLEWSIPIFSALAGHLNVSGVLPPDCSSEPACTVRWHLQLAAKALYHFVVAPDLQTNGTKRTFATLAQVSCCNQCCAAFDDEANDATRGGAALIGGVFCGGLRIPFTKIHLIKGCKDEPYMQGFHCAGVGNCD